MIQLLLQIALYGVVDLVGGFLLVVEFGELFGVTCRRLLLGGEFGGLWMLRRFAGGVGGFLLYEGFLFLLSDEKFFKQMLIIGLSIRPPSQIRLRL